MRRLLNGRRSAGCVALLSLLGMESGQTPVVHGGEALQAMGVSPGGVTVTAQDAGREVITPVGSSVIVRLETIPGTGSGWQVVQNGAPQLQLEAPARFEPRSGQEAGGVEDEVFRFRVQGPGTAELEFHYRRPWDAPAAVAKIFRIRITSE